MRRIRCQRAAIARGLFAALLIVLVLPAHAAQILGQLTGVVTLASPLAGVPPGTSLLPSSVTVGSQVQIRFSYDSATPGVAVGPVDKQYSPVGPGTTFSVVIGGLEWSTSTPLISTRRNFLLPSGQYESIFQLDQFGAGTSFPGASRGGSESDLIFDATTTGPNLLINSAGLPTTPSELQLSLAQVRTGTLISAGPQGWIVQYSVDPASLQLADIVFSNLGGVQVFDPFVYPTYSVVHNDPNRVPPNQEVAVSFTPQSRVRLDRIRMPLALVEGTPALNVTVAQDAGGIPGAALETVHYTGPFAGIFTPVPLATLNSPTNPILESNTRYWLMLSAPGPAATDIFVNVSPLHETTEVQLFRSVDLGGNWICVVPCINSQRIAFEVTGTPVSPPPPVCTNAPQSVAEDDSGSLPLFGGTVVSQAVNVGNPTTAIFNISPELVSLGAVPFPLGKNLSGQEEFPLWMSIKYESDPGVSIAPNLLDASGGVVAIEGLIRPSRNASYAVSWCNGGNARFMLLFDSNALRHTLANVFIPALPVTSKASDLLDFLDDVDEHVPLLGSALNHFEVALNGSLPASTRLQNIYDGLGDMRLLSLPKNNDQKAWYVALLFKYGFIETLDFFTKPVELLKFVLTVEQRLVADILAAGLLAQRTNDLSLSTPLVIKLESATGQ